MTSWDGKSKGRVLGYRIFGWAIKHLGLNFAYFLLLFVSAYYVFASGKAFRSIYYYFHRRLGYGKVRSLICIFRNYYLFGQEIIDKTVVLGGFDHHLTFELEGKEHLREMQEGGILISGHIGNWEIGGQALEFLGKKVNIVVFDSEKEAIRNYMSEVLTKRNVNVIVIRNDFSHMFKIKEALSNKEIVAFHGDRYIDSNKTVPISFLGEPALFPLGPWQIAGYFNKPVSYVFSIKETKRRYRFFASPMKMIPVTQNYRERDEILIPSMKDYVIELERMVRNYPLHWRNYYNFWEEQKP
jgi:predicted LPLAT superfamily acyltransferase